ncbi:MAG: transporter [Gammaproteobacteria bacterium]|nr:transporter [Gammaproteobacteria bacterium]
MFTKKMAAFVILISTAIFTHANADNSHNEARADSHAPIGVMAEHMHKKGEWMFSYRYMHMDMKDNGNGSSDISANSIATAIPNRFFGLPGQPPTLRVVPTQMTTEMHMFGLMHAPSDDLTMMVMLPFVKKTMDHITYMGGMGTTVLGGFTTKAEGVGDLKISGLYRLLDQGMHHWHANVGLSLPTGSNTETGTILAPTGATPTVRLPYPMQLGSGTYDILAGLTYSGKIDDYSWGAQYSGTFRTGSDEGYTLGDVHKVTGWVQKLLNPNTAISARLNYLDAGNISGIDPTIVLPVQTADPDRQGKERVDLAIGLTLLGTQGDFKGQRLAFEASQPLHQNLEGPQLKSDLMITVGYQQAW